MAPRRLSLNRGTRGSLERRSLSQRELEVLERPIISCFELKPASQVRAYPKKQSKPHRHLRQFAGVLVHPQSLASQVIDLVVQERRFVTGRSAEGK